MFSIVIFREKHPHYKYVIVNMFILYNPELKKLPLWLVSQKKGIKKLNNS